MTAKPLSERKVLITDYIWQDLDVEHSLMGDRGAEIVAAPDGSEETLAGLAGDVDAIVTCFAPVTGNVLQAAPKCVMVSRYGVGVDNIDVSTATELGMVVAYVPDYCMDEVSDHTILLLLALNRRLLHFDRCARTEGWGTLPLTLTVSRLRNRVLGLVGMGKIGQEVCRKARAFGMRVLAWDPYLSSEQFKAVGAESASFETMLSEADFVSIHAPLNTDTKGMIGEKAFSMMKSTAYIINCARGPIVDEAALIEALRNGKIAGAGLDVLESALPSRDNPLFAMDNVIVTPHVAFFSQQSFIELRTRASQAVVDVLSGRVPGNVANPQVFPNTRAKFSNGN
jgi:D-3-phosphoglycerate dehydrogenase